MPDIDLAPSLATVGRCPRGAFTGISSPEYFFDERSICDRAARDYGGAHLKLGKYADHDIIPWKVSSGSKTHVKRTKQDLQLESQVTMTSLA